MTDGGDDREVEAGPSPSPELAERRGLDPVYQPAEDSGLLARAAIETETLTGRVLDLGTGSGWVAAQVATETDAEVVASDVNPHACRHARARSQSLPPENAFEVVRADLLAPFRTDAFDAVLFNPPYLPTDPEHEWDDWMETALSGGETGRELIEPFLDSVGRVLASGGVALLLVSSLTGFEDVVAYATRRGFAVNEVVQESYPFETLSVLRLTR